MLRLSVIRPLSLRALLTSAVLTAASLSDVSADRLRDYPSPEFHQLDAAKARIDPINFSRPLLVAAIFQETNRQRADQGLPAFLPDERASGAARLHAKWMADNHSLSHDEPSARGTPTTSSDRLVQQGLRPYLTAENIAYNLLPDITPGRPFYTRLVDGLRVYSYQPDGPALKAHTYNDFARAVLAQWMHSPLHRAHIVNPKLQFLGVGVALSHRRGHPDTIYVAQDFFTPHGFPSGSPFDAGEATLLPRRP